ncbi:ribonuclease 3-like protein 3 [Andrographis paniculata]|uniref:ribonuclease 3-like protein 3 n=1 Tax=Andrographis paniculata TaxID=175694 RepID=UPI0021E9107A|nr:ribonuclease 3-like protein 3 [Andrographis paniculata]
MEVQSKRIRARIQRSDEIDVVVLVEKIKEITGYEFRNPNLLRQAFTAHSYLEDDKNETDSYERLEYLGDSVIGYFVAFHHYSTYPDLSVGKLTKLRSANVDGEKLARAALKHGLHRFLNHNKPMLEAQIKQFEEAIVQYPIHSFGLVDTPKALADIVESLVGAVHLDSNSVDRTFQVIDKLLEPMVTPSTLSSNPVSMLFELCQKHKLSIEVLSRSWPKTGVFEYVVGGDVIGRAEYRSKRLVAKSRAAADAYDKLVAKLEAQNRQEQTNIDKTHSEAAQSGDEEQNGEEPTCASKEITSGEPNREEQIENDKDDNIKSEVQSGDVQTNNSSYYSVHSSAPRTKKVADVVNRIWTWLVS